MTAVDLVAVQNKILEVEKNIKDVEVELKNAKESKHIDYLRDKEHQLREYVHQLMEKELILLRSRGATCIKVFVSNWSATQLAFMLCRKIGTSSCK